MAPYGSFHPPLSFSLFALPSLSLTHSLPPHFTSLSLSLFITSLFLRLLALSHWAAKELIAMCAFLSLSFFVCVFKMVSRGWKRSRGFSTPHHLGYLLPPPRRLIAGNVLDTRTQGCYVHLLLSQMHYQ